MFLIYELGRGSADDPEDVAFLHDQQVFAIELDLGAGPFAEQDLVARLDVERRDLAVLGLGAGAKAEDGKVKIGRSHV